MKRLWIMALIFGLITTGCSGGGGDDDEPTASGGGGGGDAAPTQAAEDPSTNYDPTSHLLTSGKGHYKIYFPEEPKALKGRTYEWGGKDLKMTISYWPTKQVGADHLGTNATTSLQKRKMTEAARAPKTVTGGFTGIEISGTKGAKAFKMQQFYNENTKCDYFLLVEGEPTEVNGNEGNQFLNSFAYFAE